MKSSSKIHPYVSRLGIILICLALITSGCRGTATPTIVSPAQTQIQTNTPFSPPTNTAIPSPSPAPTSQPAPTTTSAATDTVVPTTPAATGLAEVDFIDVGQGDSILVRSSEGKVALIDGGEQGSGVLAYLSSKGVTHIDLMVATHPHSDHIGGLVDVLGAIPVDRVATNGQPHTTQIYERFLDGIANAKAEYLEVKRGDTLALGNLVFQVLSPAVTASGGDFNNNSVVLRLAVGKVVFLFTGDAQADAEAGMIASGMPLKADILKVGHHGSHTSSSPALLAQVKPTIAVYMAGAGNKYGHPHVETIAALTTVGAQIYGTDTNGTIAVTTDGATYQVQAQGGPRAPPAVQVAPSAPPANTGGTAGLEIASVTSPVARGGVATLTAVTAPAASCSITVYYKSGPSKASGLAPKSADASGQVSWSWKVGTNTTRGTWRIVVTCDSATQETSFTVQ